MRHMTACGWKLCGRRAGAIDSIENYLEMGVPAGQYTQVREEKKHSLEWYEVLFAAVAAAIVAALPCFSVMRQYKMQKEHRQSLGFHMAYRADSALHLSKMRSSL